MTRLPARACCSRTFSAWESDGSDFMAYGLPKPLPTTGEIPSLHRAGNTWVFLTPGRSRHGERHGVNTTARRRLTLDWICFRERQKARGHGEEPCCSIGHWPMWSRLREDQIFQCRQFEKNSMSTMQAGVVRRISLRDDVAFLAVVQRIADAVQRCCSACSHGMRNCGGNSPKASGSVCCAVVPTVWLAEAVPGPRY